MLKRLVWRDGGVICLALKEELFTLAQMRIRPYMQFFDVFNESGEWSNIDLNEVRELFCVTVASKTCIKSLAVAMINTDSVKVNNRLIPKLMINPNLNFSQDGGYPFLGGNLIEIDNRGETVGMPIIKRDLRVGVDDKIIVDHELTNMWTTPEEVKERLLRYYEKGINWDTHKEKVFPGIEAPSKY